MSSKIAYMTIKSGKNQTGAGTGGGKPTVADRVLRATKAISGVRK